MGSFLPGPCHPEIALGISKLPLWAVSATVRCRAICVQFWSGGPSSTRSSAAATPASSRGPPCTSSSRGGPVFTSSRAGGLLSSGKILSRTLVYTTSRRAFLPSCACEDSLKQLLYSQTWFHSLTPTPSLPHFNIFSFHCLLGMNLLHRCANYSTLR